MFGTSIPINMFRTFAFYYFVVQRAGITATQFALILTIYTIVDAIDNPVYGFLSDNTRSRWGRRRPWLVIAAPLLALSFIMFFNVPEWLAPGSLFWYALIMYMMTGTLDAMINCNYGGLFPELFKTQAERAKTNAMRQGFQFVAMIISMALTPIIAEAIGFGTTAIIYSIFAVAVIYYMAFNCHETEEAQNRPKAKLLGSIRDIIKNPKFWKYGITNACFFAALAVLQQSVAFFTRYVLGEGGLATTIMLASVIVFAIIGIPIWVKVVKKLGLMKTWRLSLGVITISLIPLFFVDTLILSAIPLVLLGLGYGGASVTMDIVAARILDEDKARHNVQRESTFFSLTGVLNKTSGLFAAAGFLMVSVFFGYVSGDQPGPTPDVAARFLMSYYPFVIMIACCILSFFLKFKEDTKTES
jgi:GPH family glycoside/pentoside/hexuronide:cation symporter